MDLSELVLGPKIKRLSVRLPLETWKQLRRLQEAGKIESIHAAILSGLNSVITDAAQ